MIRFLQELVCHDFWLKLFSLGLATLIWLTVSFAIRKEGSPVPALSLRAEEQRTFMNLPVILTVEPSAQGVRNIKISPMEVEVTVQGEPRNLRDLQVRDIRVTVDLTGVEAAEGLRKRVEVATREGVSLVRVIPSEVDVIFPTVQ